MPGNKKPRKKYVPKPVVTDTMHYVKTTLSPVDKTDGAVALRIKNHDALLALCQGRGMWHELDVMIAVSNVTMAMVSNGVGEIYRDVARAGADALEAVRARVRNRKVGALYATEIAALQRLVELHDAQLDISTVGELDVAVQKAVRKVMAEGV